MVFNQSVVLHIALIPRVGLGGLLFLDPAVSTSEQRCFVTLNFITYITDTLLFFLF